jgi:hypothetical protein
MHPNEIKITESNIDYVRKMAEELGPKYLEAVEEQIVRQRGK